MWAITHLSHLYPYVTRHFLGSVSPDCVFKRTKAVFTCGGETFTATGTSAARPGFTAVMPWKVLEMLFRTSQLLWHVCGEGASLGCSLLAQSRSTAADAVLGMFNYIVAHHCSLACRLWLCVDGAWLHAAWYAVHQREQCSQAGPH